MPVIFELDESYRQQLQDLVTDENWQAAYQFVIDLASDPTPGLERPATGMNMAEWLWIRGAMQVNSHTGSRLMMKVSEPLSVTKEKARAYWRGESSTDPRMEILFDGDADVTAIGL